MAISIDVRTDIKEASKYLNKIQKQAIPRVTARALNKTVTSHRNLGLKQVAKELRLPQRNVTSRFDKNGKKKAERATVKKANKNNLEAEISVYARGIPVVQVISKAQKARAAIKPRKGGIKAAGGRTYKRVFVAEAKGGNVQVFTRLGKSQYEVGVPKIGVREAIKMAYNKAMGKTGLKVFRKEFDRLMRVEAGKDK